MKQPKNEPYQRPRHRAALRAWAVAATTVASIGMAANATGLSRGETLSLVQRDDQAPTRDAARVAAEWIDTLQHADLGAAEQLMRVPASADAQHAVQMDLQVMSDLLTQPGVYAEPVAHRRAGHWALSVWQLDHAEAMLGPVLEPVALYHPSSDGLFESTAEWQVVPQGFSGDAALTPLYNADYDALQDWSKGLL